MLYVIVDVLTLTLTLTPTLLPTLASQVLYVVVDVLARMERPASFTELTYTKASPYVRV